MPNFVIPSGFSREGSALSSHCDEFFSSLFSRAERLLPPPNPVQSELTLV